MVCRRKTVSSQLSPVSMVIPVTLAAVAFESLWKPPGHHLWQLQALDKLGRKQTKMDGPALPHHVFPHLSLLGGHPVKEYFISEPFIRTPN